MVSDLQSIGTALAKDPDQHLEFEANRETIAEIIRLRDEKNVLILGHNYMAPLVYHLSPDYARGDSLALSRIAAESDHPIILFDGVRFMAETAKILNPSKKVIIADMDAGCSLADPFSPEDVQRFRDRHPGAPVVTYVNSYADIKAVSDYCCTSANCKQVVIHAAKTFGTDKVIFFPDSLMGANLAVELKDEGIQIIYPGTDDQSYGACEVHEKFTPQHLQEIRQQFHLPKNSSDTAVLAHWECKPEVVEEADFCGSTSQMSQYIADRPQLKRVFLATECEMAANLSLEFPEVEFVKSCNIFCQHMQKITLEKILHSLQHEVHEVHVDPEIAKKAKVAIDRMLEI